MARELFLSVWPPRHPRRVLLGMVLALAAWLRFRNLDDATLTGDEMLSWMHAHEPLSHILTHSLAPLHHFLAWVALALGSTEGVLRLPSALAGVAGCWVAYALGKRAHSAPAGLVAALVLAVSPFLTLHSREARYYALMTLAALVVVWTLWRAIEDDDLRAWLRFALVSIPALLVHMFMLPFQAVAVGCAAILVAVRRPAPGARRWHAVGRLAVAALVGGSGVLAIALHDATRLGIVRDTVRHALPGDAGDSEPEAARTLYRLTPEEFASYGGEWSFLTNTRGEEAPVPALAALGLLAAAGLVTLLVRRLSLGLLCVAVMVLMPLPFFLVDVTHWHEAKYYAPIFALLALCIGVGLAEIGRLAALLLQKRISPAWEPWLPGTVTAAAVLVAGAFVAAPMWDAQGFAQERPQYRWREVAEFMEDRFTPNDLVFYLVDFGADAASIDRGMRFHFERDVPNGLARLYATRPFVGVLEPADLAMHAAQNPDKALWLLSINEYALEADLIQAIERLEPLKKRFGLLTLWAVGAPGVNMVVDGAFQRDDLPEGQNVTVSREAEERGIRLEPGEDPPQVVTLPLRPHPYRLRNPDFALWQQGPLYWTIDAPGPPQLAQVGGPDPDMLAMAVRPQPDGEVVVSQSIALGAAAGHTVGIRALASSDNPNQLGLRLTVGGRQFEAWHEGTRAWSPLVLSAEIPAGAEVDDCEVAIVVRPGGDAAITQLKIGLDPGAPSLDPATDYSLSFAMRTAGLPLYHDMARIGFLYTVPGADDAQWTPLYEFGHTAPWQRYAFGVRPGEDLPINATGVTLAIQFQSDEGTVWLDEVQLEPRPSPTLFTDGIRLPHDEQWMRTVIAERAGSQPAP